MHSLSGGPDAALGNGLETSTALLGSGKLHQGIKQIQDRSK